VAENGIEDFVIIHLNFISTDRPLLMDGSTISIVQAAPVAFFDVEKSRSRNVVPPGVDITYNCPFPRMFRTGGIAPTPPKALEVCHHIGGGGPLEDGCSGTYHRVGLQQRATQVWWSGSGCSWTAGYHR
jgi:hypothetical protein